MMLEKKENKNKTDQNPKYLLLNFICFSCIYRY